MIGIENIDGPTGARTRTRTRTVMGELYRPEDMVRRGFKYSGIGRG